MSISKSNAPVPENIKRIIKGKGLIGWRVGEKAGYTPQQFSDMLNGRKIIKPCDILAISSALGIGVGDLFVSGQNSA